MKKSTKSTVYGISFVLASYAVICVLGYAFGTLSDYLVKTLG